MQAGELGVFPALLRDWRHRRGMSQLDLSLAAEVSSRHISFLETGRAQPSRDMVLILAGALDVPMRDQNVLLRAAGFAEQFAEPSWQEGLPPAVERVLDHMLRKQEPFPMVVLSHCFDVVRANTAAFRLVAALLGDSSRSATPTNLMRALFDPQRLRPCVEDWEQVARSVLGQLRREALARPNDGALHTLLRDLVRYPNVPKSLRQSDLSTPSEPTLTLRLRRGELALSFVTTVTVFSTPQMVTLQELRIESYFPLDSTTERACEQIARGAGPRG